MARHAEQDVDAVGADHRRDGVVVMADGGTIAVGGGAVALGDLVGAGDLAVAERLELSAVAPFDQADDVMGDGIGAEIGGEIADAERPVGIAVVIVRPRPGIERPRVALLPVPVRCEQGFGP